MNPGAAKAKRGGRLPLLVGFLLPLWCAVAFAGADKAVDAGTPALVRAISTLQEGGARLDWLHERIAFDMRVGEYFAVHTMQQDGTGVRCVTCSHPDLPRRNIGQPAWHPSGRYLVFQAEKDQHDKVRFEHVVTPGAGVLNDLWLLDLGSNRAQPLREVGNRRGQGILHAHFSSDGRRLSWSEMQREGGLSKGTEFGFWALMVADFRINDGTSQLDNVRAYTPGGPAFYENHGFSPDGKQLIFSSNFEARRRIEAHIYTLDLQTGKLNRLTTENYNEHALYSPDGKHIVWMTTAGNRYGGTDYWIMDSDGSNKRRLTWFNRKGHPEHAGEKVVVADFSWRPDGTAFAGYYREGGVLESREHPTRIVLIELNLETLQ